MKVVCVDNHVTLFVSREELLAARRRQELRQELPTDFMGCLTVGKVYEVLGEEHGHYRIIDASGEDYLYPKWQFRPVDAPT